MVTKLGNGKAPLPEDIVEIYSPLDDGSGRGITTPSDDFKTPNPRTEVEPLPARFAEYNELMKESTQLFGGKENMQSMLAGEMAEVYGLKPYEEARQGC